MKRTRRKSILRTIRGSLNRFLTILAIVALGAGFLAGLFAAAPDMREAADQYMDDYGYYDLDVKSALGLSKEDAQAVAALPGVLSVTPVKVIDALVACGERGKFTARIFANIDLEKDAQDNGLRLLEGRMPVRAGECVVQSTAGGYFQDAPQIGDELTLPASKDGGQDVGRYFKVPSFIVVGLVQSPMFISVEPEPSVEGAGAIGLAVFAPKACVNLPFYTDLYIEAVGAKKLQTFDQNYKAAVSALIQGIEKIAPERAALRLEQVESEALHSLDALKKMISALEMAADVQIKLAADIPLHIRNTERTLLALADNKEAEALRAALSETAAGMAGAVNSERAFDRTEALRSAAKQAEAELEGLTLGQWFIQTRDDARGFSGYRENVDKVEALSKIFPVFFFFVALLVALTTMTRLVDENRGKSGTLKAIGYSSRMVLSEYMIYSLLASLLGCGLGFAIGFKVFPAVISAAYGMMYFIPAVPAPFRADIALSVMPLTVGSILLATLAACYTQLRDAPAALMVLKAPAPGKRILLERITPLWKRLPFTYKVTCRNLFRYKKRLLMTIVGAAGCSALLVAGFGLRDSIHDIVDKQFGELFRYDLTVLLKSEDALTHEALQAALNDKTAVESFLSVAGENGKAMKDGAEQAVTLTVPSDSNAFADYVTLRSRKEHTPVLLADGGVVLSEKLGEQLDAGIGDIITLQNAEGKRAQAKVSGITENYVTAYAYMTHGLYEELFLKAPELNTVFCLTAQGANLEELIERVLKSGDALYARSNQSIKDTFAKSVGSIDMIVLVLILSAGLLSVVVLYNLTNINICERRKELATLRVLGFHESEAQRYIFRETNVLSLLGTLFGLAAGIWLHGFVVKTVEVSSAMFGREIAPLSFAYAFLLSIVFTFLVNRIMCGSIRQIDMVEAMKAND